MIRNDLRNIAIIAHVDHGKTTLVNEMLAQGGVFRENQQVQDRVMDSGDLEKERGITILAKNTSAHYNGVKINIIDTPGHADFSGEVERVLKMVNGAIILVDSAEGPLPQTRFVMQKALSLGLKMIIVINKVDRPDARIAEVVEEMQLLMMDLDATDEQLDSPIVYCCGRQGTASLDPDHQESNLNPLFDTILETIPPMEMDVDGPGQLLVSCIDYNEFVGRIGIGRIARGTIKSGEVVSIASNYNGFYGNVSGNTISLTTTQTEYVADGDVVNYYGVINSRFTLLGNGTTVAHERAHVQIKNGQLDCPNPPAFLPALAPGARRVVAGATGINTATGVDQVQGDNVPTKMIINGQLFILRGEKMYDAQGKLVK